MLPAPPPPPDRREPRKQDYATEPAQPAPTGAHRCPRIASGQRHTGRSFLKGTHPTTFVITSHKRAEGILSPPITQKNPINQQTQKKQTESSNRLELAPWRPRCVPSGNAQRPYKEYLARTSDIPSNDGTPRINRAEGTLSPPLRRMNPMNHQDQKNQTES